VLLGPLLWRGFLLSGAEFESSCVVVGPRLGREVSSPDVIELEFPPLAGHGCYAARVSVV
jgi:hypothetical protein